MAASEGSGASPRRQGGSPVVTARPTLSPFRPPVASVREPCLTRALSDRLTPEERNALKAVYLDNLTYDEAAKKLGITKKALDMQLFRAKKQLHRLREKVA